MIPAFLAAYGKKSANTISLSEFPSILNVSPNWSVTYDGLAKLPFFKRYFKSITISHAYRSTYSVNSYTTNPDYNPGDDGYSWVKYQLDQQNFIPQFEVDGVSISEQFSPLINIDVTMNNDIIAKVEIQKTRELDLGFSDNEIIENKGNDIIIGTGYRIKNVKLPISVSGVKKVLKSDVNIKVDMSIRNTTTITREIVQEINQITSGNQIITLKTSAIMSSATGLM